MEMPTTYRYIVQPRHLTTVMVERLRQTIAELLASEQHPAYVGVAFGLGTLMSLNPVPVLDMMLALLLLRSMPRLPRAPYMAAMATWNSVVMAPLYASMPGVGRLVIGTARLPFASAEPSELLLNTLVGGIVVAGILVAASSGSITFLTHIIRCHYQRRVAANPTLTDASNGIYSISNSTISK